MKTLLAVFAATLAATPALAAEPDGLILPPGFHANIVADGLKGVRHMAFGSNGDLTEAEHHLRLVLAQDPCHEDATARLMAVLQAAGRRVEALRAYEELSTALARDLGARHDTSGLRGPGDTATPARASRLRVVVLARPNVPRTAGRSPAQARNRSGRSSPIPVSPPIWSI